MVTGVLANLLNIALDPIFIFGWGPLPALGVLGAAIATGLAFVLDAVLLIVCLRPHLAGVPIGLDRSLLREIFRLGAPLAAMRGADVVSWVLFVSVLARVGDVHLAAHIIGIRVICISFLPGLALSEAAGVLVGQAVGSGDRAAARSVHIAARQLSIGIMLVCGIGFVLAPDLLISVFGAEVAVREVARNVLYVAAAFQVFDAIATAGLCSLSGAGDTRFVMVLTIGAAWLVKLPLALLLAVYLELGAPGAWLALFGEIALIAAVVVWRTQGSSWLSAAEPEPEPEPSPRNARPALA